MGLLKCSTIESKRSDIGAKVITNSHMIQESYKEITQFLTFPYIIDTVLVRKR